MIEEFTYQEVCSDTEAYGLTRSDYLLTLGISLLYVSRRETWLEPGKVFQFTDRREERTLS